MDSYDKGSEADTKSIATDVESHILQYEHQERMGCCLRVFNTWWKKTLGKIAGDWVFLTTLGVSMAWISLLVETGFKVCEDSRIYLYRDLASHPFFQYFCWVGLPVCLICFSTTFTRLLAPQAAGSGIPEMKTTLKGVILKDTLSMKALITKVIGLTATLGTGLPVGKEGPFVHVASMAAFLLSKAIATYKGNYSKARNAELLAAACAVGVAMAFAAPIGGVLFSIEVTAVHFAVRNYWRGFYAAVCATVMHRLIAVWFKNEETLTAVFRSSFTLDTPFSPLELFAFAFLGVISGFLGAFFVWLQRQYVIFKENNRIMKAITSRNFLLYPVLVTLFFSTLTFPLGLGMFAGGDLTLAGQMESLFANFSWTKENPTVAQFEVISHWQTPYTPVFVSLFFYVILSIFGLILATTIPVPAGVFIPMFKAGAGLGRLVGELMAYFFPHTVNSFVVNPLIFPGGYSIVGAAALGGAATHTVSSSVIAFEVTGQLVFAIPVMVAVFIANGVAQMLQPSIFDSLITLKKLPYLPSIPSTSSKAYDVFVEDFMVRDVKFIWYGITYTELKSVITANKLRAYPIVDSADSMILLGSASRRELITLIENNVSYRKKMQFYNEWKTKAEKLLSVELNKGEENTNSFVQAEDVVDEEKGASGKPLADPPANATPPRPLQPFHLPAADIASIDDCELSDTDSITPYTDTELCANDDLIPNTDLTPNTDPNSDDPIDTAVPNKERRPSRFSVTKVEGPLLPDHSDVNKEHEFLRSYSTLTESSLPKKSILKQTQSFNFDTNKPVGIKHPYATIHAGEARGVMYSLSSILRTKSLIRMDSSKILSFSGVKETPIKENVVETKIKGLERKWEEKEMKKTVDFTSCQINPAPHQLVERSNLLQVHSLFSLLGLNHSYVTAIGRLIGVVGLKEVREAVTRLNSGDISRPGVPNNRRYSFGFLSLR